MGMHQRLRQPLELLKTDKVLQLKSVETVNSILNIQKWVLMDKFIALICSVFIKTGIE